MDIEDLRLWLRLTRTLGVGVDSAHTLLKALGLPEQIFAAPMIALRQLVGEKKALALRTEPQEMDAALDTLLAWLDADPRRHVLALNDPLYPKALLQLTDAPLLLYVQGSLPLTELDAQRGIAIVGSRNPTPQGLANARQFAKHFSDAGLHVVSGLALGIDAAAHEGALQGTGSTIAVVGTGLDRVYPRANHVLAHQISERGLIVSEFELGTPPLAANFPRRNRIISALSQGCLVVEAAIQSGSLITARLSNEQGREVFSIPGSIHSAQSKGCHALIKQGAKLVESAQDVLEELHFSLQPSSLRAAAPSKAAGKVADKGASKQEPQLASPPSSHTETALHAEGAAAADTDADADGILTAMGYDPIGFDSLQARTGHNTPQLQAKLLELEMTQQIARLPGGLWQRLVLG